VSDFTQAFPRPLVVALLQHPRHPLACTVGVVLATVASLAGSLAMIVMTGGSTSVLFSLLVLASAERERLQLERLAEVGRLAAAVAHEVSGPLSAIRSNLACLLRDPELAEPDRRAALLDAHAAVEQAIEILERVRTVMWQEGRPASPE
jgi:signal transduction histidine kinase